MQYEKGAILHELEEVGLIYSQEKDKNLQLVDMINQLDIKITDKINENQAQFDIINQLNKIFYTDEFITIFNKLSRKAIGSAIIFYSQHLDKVYLPLT